MPAVDHFLKVHRGEHVNMHFDRGHAAGMVQDDLVQRTAGAGAGSSVFGVGFFADHGPGRRCDHCGADDHGEKE